LKGLQLTSGDAVILKKRVRRRENVKGKKNCEERKSYSTLFFTNSGERNRNGSRGGQENPRSRKGAREN